MKPYKIFADNIDPKALDQFYDAMKQDFVVQGALMPDAHLGYSLPIGAVIATKDVVVPAWVGYDIGCGMCAVPTTFDAKELVGLKADSVYDAILRAIPVGFNHHKTAQCWPKYETLNKTPMLKDIFEGADSGFRQLGTLGGGNHFIEIGVDETEIVWIIIHSGSRNIGHKTATYYMKLASGSDKAKEGHYFFKVDTQQEMSYYMDAKFCQEFALANRTAMLYKIEEAMNSIVPGHLWMTKLINRNHNHVEWHQKSQCYIHRKGATHAEEGMLGVIPGNMRDGSFIVRGHGNPASLSSSSHGAGRVLGRKEAKRVLSEGDFELQMKGIKANVGASTLDESPGAYKDIFEVMELQKDLVTVIAHVKPLINIKG